MSIFMSIGGNPKRLFWSNKIIRFFCVGVINTIVDFSILNILVDFLHLFPLVANLISASISITISYFMNHYVVFRISEKHTTKKFIHFFVATGSGILVVQSAIIYIVITLLNLHLPIIKEILTSLHLNSVKIQTAILNIAKLAAVLVAMVWNFMIYHFVIFKPKDMTV